MRWGVPAPDTTATLAAAYEQSLLYGEHTWGGAFWWIYGKYMLKFGDEWKAGARRRQVPAHRVLLGRTHGLHREGARPDRPGAAKANCDSLAQAVNVAGPRIVVFNPLPWQRDGRGAVAVKRHSGSLADVSQRGQANPVGRHALTASLRLSSPGCLPPMGYQDASLPESGETRTADCRLDDPDSDASRTSSSSSPSIRRAAAIASLIDTRSGRELVDASAPQGFGQYLYERFDRDQVQAFVKAYVKINADWGINELGKPSLPPASAVPYLARLAEEFQTAL